jgi:hypothetical protein
MRWTSADDQRLLELKGQGKLVSAIAKAMRRTEVAVADRFRTLKKRGIDWFKITRRAMQVRHLALAERHVAQGERHIAEQEERIATIDRRGRNTAEATRLLMNFYASQALHIQHRDRIRNELKREGHLTALVAINRNGEERRVCSAV